MLDYLIKGGRIVDGGGGEPADGDVGIRDGLIVAIGSVKESAREVVDADGALVTPGFFDLHTHYDGQVTWDDALEPSASNGVSTVVLGNCGVGFAPVRPTDHAELIDMMEGVEDIPGTALADGIPWGEWETFPEYLDVVDRRSYAANVMCHISHAPLRYYVMGERAYEDHDASADEVNAMSSIVAEALAAGAAGFSTNRYQIHKSRRGRIVPGTFAPYDELRAIAARVGEAEHGVIQAISEGTLTPNADVDEMPELDLFGSISVDTGRPLTFTTAQANPGTDVFRRVLEGTAQWNARGAQLRPQIIPRAVTIMTMLGGYHGFIFRPSYQAIAEMPVAERAAVMRRPEIRERILNEQDEPTDTGEFLLAMVVMNNLDRVFSLAPPIDYEPDPSQSIAAQAAAQGVDPAAHYYDLLCAGDGGGFFAALTSNFVDGTLEPSREMLMDRHTVSGLSDAGAHVMMISDCSSSTFHLTHWVRDRTRGSRIPVQTAIHKLTGAPAQMYGFTDRGLVRVGMRADVNVIDLERLTIESPVIRADLPSGARRILQPSTGYVARLVNGVMVRRNDIDTAERPGHLLRSRQRTVAA